MKRWLKIEGRERRRRIMRGKLGGTMSRPRLSVRRSLKHIYAQLIDDTSGKTIAALSTLSPEIREKCGKDGGNVKGSALVGAAIAEAGKRAGITKIVFDRAGYLYHGRVKALAEAARKGGLQF
jgi:large subunit ribosomal protein L18